MSATLDAARRRLADLRAEQAALAASAERLRRMESAAPGIRTVRVARDLADAAHVNVARAVEWQENYLAVVESRP